MSLFETLADFIPVWIPTSERLPQKFADVLITTPDGEVVIAMVRECYDFTHNTPSYEWVDCYKRCYDRDEIKAWLRLPTPYKEKKND